MRLTAKMESLAEQLKALQHENLTMRQQLEAVSLHTEGVDEQDARLAARKADLEVSIVYQTGVQFT